MRPAVLLGNRLAGGGAQRRAVRPRQVEQHVQQHRVVLNTPSKLAANRGILRILARSELRERQMLAHQQRRLGDHLVIEAHTP